MAALTERPRVLWLAMGALFLFLATVPVVALVTSEIRDAKRSELARIEPIGAAVDDVTFEVIAARATATSEELPEITAAGRLADLATGTEFAAGASLLLESIAEVRQATAPAAAPDAVDPVLFNDPALAALVQRGAALRTAIAERARSLRSEVRRLDRIEAGVLVGTSVIGLTIAGLVLSVPLRRSRMLEGRFASLVDAVSDVAVCELDAAGRVVYASPSAARVLGVDARTLIALDFHARVHAPAAGSDVCPILAVAKTGTPWQGETRFVRLDDGTELPVEVHAMPAGTPRRPRVMLAFTDISGRRRREEVQEEFVSLASHELRNPLTSIHGFGRRLLQQADRADPPNDELREAAAVITNESARMAATIRLLRDLASLQAGVFEVEPEPTDVVALAREEADRAAAGYGTDRIRFAQATPCHCETDPTRVREILSNLIENGIKHGGQHVVVRVECRPGGVSILVQDDGPGIAPEIRSQIFRRRFRGAAGSRGQGLGLFLSHALAKALRGDLRFDCPAAGGAIFELALPCDAQSDGP